MENNVKRKKTILKLILHEICNDLDLKCTKYYNTTNLIFTVEWFLNDTLPILGYDGKPKIEPKTIFDPVFFQRFHGASEFTMRSLMGN